MYRTAVDIWSGKAKVKYGKHRFYLKAKPLNPFGEGFLSFAISKHIGEQDCLHVHIVGTIHYRRVGGGGIDQWHISEQTDSGSKLNQARHRQNMRANCICCIFERRYLYREGLLY